MASARTPLLTMRGITKSFGATSALAGVDLDLGSGEIHALLGENGAGKSTLMKVLAGALAPDAGTSTLEGELYAPRDPREAAARGVRMVHQELALCPELSVAENLLLGSEPARAGWIDRRAQRMRARAALEAVGKPELDLDVPVARLALADRQMVEIARALAQEARVLVLDEPTSSLQRAEVERLFELLRSLAQRAVSVLYISHALEEVCELCERWTVLRDGRTIATGEVRGTSEREWIEAMVGREVRELYPRSLRVRGERILRARGLEVHRGEVLGIYGLVGAGRTEFLRGLFGLGPVDARELELLAQLGARTPRERWQSGAGYVSEDRKSEGLALGLSLTENLALPSLARWSRGGVLARASVRAEAELRVAELGVKCVSVEQPCGELSGGNQQKVALARLMCARSELLLLDEPTRGIDVGSKAQVYAWIDALARGEGGASPKGIVLVSSHLSELLGVCDRIAVMRRGELGAARAVADCDEASLLSAAMSCGSAR